MKKIYTLLFVLFTFALGYSQTSGITYQAVIMNPDGEQIPGKNLTTAPLVNQNICMQFSIIDKDSQVEYQETIQTATDNFGIVNLLIGTGNQTGGYATTFSGINWGNTPKNLKVSLNAKGTCTDFIEISNQPFSAVPYALATNSANIVDGSIKDSKIESLSANKITGILAIENGGTGASNITDAKVNLGLNNVDNTSDINKPISTATQTALDTKEDLVNKSTNITTDGTSDTKYPSVKSVKTYVDASASATSTALTTEINRATAAENTEITNRTVAVTTLTTNLNTEIANRTAADALKEDLANKSTNVTTDGTSDTKYPSVKSVKTYVDASTTATSTALATEATTRANADTTLTTNLATETTNRTTAVTTLTTNLNTEITNRTNADALKEDLANKSTNVTTDGTSDTKYPSVKSVKTYVDASTTTASTALATEATTRANADTTLTTNLATETNNRTTAVTTLTTNLNTEITNRTNADALKEDLANKSTNVTTDGTSDTKYPSVKSVKTYVDTSAATASTALANEVTRASTAEAAKADKTNGASQITDTTTGGYTNIGTSSGATQATINAGVNNTLGTVNTKLANTLVTVNGYQVKLGDNITVDASDFNDSSNPAKAGYTNIGLGGTNTLGYTQSAINSAVNTTLGTVNTKLANTLVTVNGYQVKLGDNITVDTSDFNDSSAAAKAGYTNMGLAAGSGYTQTAINTAVNTTLGTKADASDLATINAKLANTLVTVNGYQVKLGDDITVDTSDFKDSSPAAQAGYTNMGLAAGSGYTQTAVNTAVNTTLGTKAPLASPTFTGNVNTNGTITAGTVTYPNAHGTSGQVLSTNGTGTLTWVDAQSGPQGPAGPTGTISAQGTWSAAVTYSQNQVVFFSGSSYVSLQNSNTNHTPPSSPTFWGLLASQGATGATGATGPQGSTGADGAGFANGTAAGQIYLTGSTPFAPQSPQNVTGDVTISSTAVTSIANNTTSGNHIASALGSASSGTTGSGNVVLATSPTLVTPSLGTINSGNGAALTGLQNIANNSTAGNSIVTALGSATTGTIPAARLGTGTTDNTTFLRGDGTWTTASYSSVNEASDEFTSNGASSQTFTLTQTPKTGSIVKMYISGMRIQKGAYTISGKTVTYNFNNDQNMQWWWGSPLSGMIVQFDYSY